MNYSNHVVPGSHIANFPNFSFLSLSTSSEVNFTAPTEDPAASIVPKWGVLAIVFIVFCTALGNLLVCLAVIWDRRLQNMTNYFLMSLAIADFLVSILVMPFGMIVELFGMTIFSLFFPIKVLLSLYKMKAFHKNCFKINFLACVEIKWYLKLLYIIYEKDVTIFSNIKETILNQLAQI